MDLFKLVGTIALSGADKAKKKIKDTSNTASAESEKINKAFEKIGSGAVAVGKKVVAGVAVAGTALAGLVAASVKDYAEYEQLAGGAQLLFGDAYDFVANKAANAYKTVQMSQSDYLQQVNGFSTGLKTALGGNEQAAAELADKIITAEADVIAATGNTAENVQNAFNGIMKSNFTMLDNLQLGITPTKEGFQEVIDKVNDWNKANGNATKYQIDNLADCQSALVDYIEMQGIAGYASAEAAETISGSLSMTKAAWDNLVAGLASDNADIPSLVSDVVSSGAKVIENIIPVAKNVLKSLPAAISEISPEAGAAFQTMVDVIMGILPGLKTVLKTTFNIVCDVINFMNEHQGLMVAIASVIGVITIAIGAYNAVQAIKNALDITGTLTLGAMTSAIWANVAAMAAALAPYLAIVAAVAAVIAIGVLLYKNWDEIKAKCIELGKNLKEKFTQIKDNVVNKVTELKDKAVRKFNEVKTKIVDICSGVVNWVKSNWKSILTFFINPFAGLFTYFYQNSSKFREFVDNAINAIKQLPSKAWTWLQNTIAKVTTFASNLANKGKQAGVKLLNNVVNGVKSLPSKMSSVGKDVVQGIWKGITNAKDWLLNKIKGFTKTITQGIKDFFGIKSPSRVMRDEVGKMLAEGVAEGIEKNSDAAELSAEEMGKKIVDAAQKRLDDYKVYNDLTLADEMAYWDKVRQLCAEGTDARINADKNYLTAKKNLDAEVLAAEEELQNSLNAVYEKIAARKKEILNSLELFEDDDENLFDVGLGWYSDIKNLEEYLANIEVLEGRIGGTDLFDAVREQGLDAFGWVKQLTEASDSQLQGYINLYDKRSELAGKLAEDDLKDETLKGVAKAYETFYNKCSGLGVSIVEDTAAMETSMTTSFTSISEMAVAKSTEIVGTVQTFLADLKAAFESFAPKLKMPHFTISGSLDIENGTVPTVAVEWYKKAVNSPMLLDNATIFGYNRATGNFMGGGEAGSEVVAGANTLMGMIKKAVAEENSGLVDILAKILSAIVRMDSNMGIHLREALEDMGLEINNREFVRLVKAVN